MKRMTSFAQLLLRFKVRELTRRTGRRPTRQEYQRIFYQVNSAKAIAQVRDRKRRRITKRWCEWLIEELRKA